MEHITYNGKKIVYIDYRGLSEDKMIEKAEALKTWLLENKAYHLRLVNISDTYAKPKFTSYIRQLGKETKDIPFKGAIVGITGAKRVLLTGYNRLLGGKMKPFDTEEEAKNYLVS